MYLCFVCFEFSFPPSINPPCFCVGVKIQTSKLKIFDKIQYKLFLAGKLFLICLFVLFFVCLCFDCLYLKFYVCEFKTNILVFFLCVHDF